MVSMTMMALAPPVGSAVSSRNRSAFVPTTTRTSTITCASKSTSSAKPAPKEKGFLETFFTGITKEEQLYETNPILNGRSDESPSKTTTKSKTTKGTVAAPPPKKSSGFGGLGDIFSKK